MHRQFADKLAGWLTRAPAFDPFRYFIDMADNRVPFTKTQGRPMPVTYGTKRVPTNVVFIDDAVIFTNAGILQVTRLDIVNQHRRPRRSQWPPKQS
jgi:hypothetical protein